MESAVALNCFLLLLTLLILIDQFLKLVEKLGINKLNLVIFNYDDGVLKPIDDKFVLFLLLQLVNYLIDEFVVYFRHVVKVY